MAPAVSSRLNGQVKHPLQPGCVAETRLGLQVAGLGCGHEASDHVLNRRSLNFPP